MPIELGIWRIDEGLEAIQSVSLNLESRLEEILVEDISIASPNWMIIGRQVRTAYDKLTDLLAIDSSGNLVLIELKRDKTYRDIVAQVLDYGSWIKSLEDDDIAQIYQAYLSKFHPDGDHVSIDEAFCKRFSVKEMPDDLNDSHELVIVASNLDAATERIVTYLSEEYDVKINAVFFRVFKDGDREYLTRAWLREPSQIDTSPGKTPHTNDKWNGEYYASFGASPHRDWDEAVKYGFVSGGGGSWYSNTLSLLEPGARIWVNIPGTGYVGVGKVVEKVIPVDDFYVEENGQQVRLIDLSAAVAGMTQMKDDPEKAEKLVRVEWLKTVSSAHAIKEKGFFGNQNTVARPTVQKWNHTIERLKRRFEID